MTTAALQLQYCLEPLIPLLADGTEDIAINSPEEAWVRRHGVWTPYPLPTMDFDTMLDLTIISAAISQQDTGAKNPLLFTDIPMEGLASLRLMAIQPPAVEPGNIAWTLRQPGDKVHPVSKFGSRYKTERWNRWQRRAENRDHTQALALYDAGDIEAFLEHVVQARYNLLLCGATGSGKTTAANSLIASIPLDERIITIENAREYRLRQPNRLHLLYSQGGQGIAKVTQHDLQVASLRCRPDRVLVQELLDPEAAVTYVQEVVSGHPGSITTIHGRNAAQAFTKLFNFVKSSVAGASQQDATVVAMLAAVVDCIIPFHNDGTTFEIGEVFFAPEAARRGESIRVLLEDGVSTEPPT